MLDLYIPMLVMILGFGGLVIKKNPYEKLLGLQLFMMSGMIIFYTLSGKFSDNFAMIYSLLISLSMGVIIIFGAKLINLYSNRNEKKNE